MYATKASFQGGNATGLLLIIIPPSLPHSLPPSLPPLQNYTQYIPLSVYDLQAWMGSPSIYVYDCSHAGREAG